MGKEIIDNSSHNCPRVPREPKTSPMSINYLETAR